MKKTLKRMFILVLACVLSFSMLACGSKKDGEDNTKDPAKTGVDFTKYPTDLNEWKLADMQKYLEDSGVFTESSWIIPISGGELTAMAVTAGLGYMDTTKGSTTDMIFYFDPNTTDENIKAQAEAVKTNHVLSVQSNSMPLDTMVGNFAISYIRTTDNNHVEALKKAIDDLAAHFNIKAEF